MKVFFYKTNPEAAADALRSAEGCAFWYAPGLTAYAGLETVVDLTELYVEESIRADFGRQYPDLVRRVPPVSFPARAVASSEPKVCFLVSNDTITYLLQKQFATFKKHIVYAKPGENAGTTAVKLGFQARETTGHISTIQMHDLLVMGNDWGLLEQKINADFLSAKKNTICVQESVIDFKPAAGRRMLHCSVPVYQGIATLKQVDLRGKICAVIGNARYEELKMTPLPATPQVLLNVNFTYGIHEEARQTWVDDIVDSCAELGVPYRISQHPRDRGDLSAYHVIRTNAGTVHDVLRESSVLVTRFSSLIHESLCLGRPVIYYNPHGERLFYDFESDDDCLVYAQTKAEVAAALRRLTAQTDTAQSAERIRAYLNRHLGTTTRGDASAYLTQFLRDAATYPPLKTVNPLKNLLLSLKVTKRRALREKF